MNSFNPATGKVDLLGQLSDFLVSPSGRWVAGPGPGDPKVDAEANSVYVLSVHGSGAWSFLDVLRMLRALRPTVRA